jgi:esterase/lipase
MRFIKRIFIFLIVLIGSLGIIYLVGPKPEPPAFKTYNFTLIDSLSLLEAQLNSEEKKVVGLKPDNEARIVWNDSIKKNKTSKVILYLHGFSASQKEGDPVHRMVAKYYNANLYLARLAGHGIDLGDNTMIDLKTDALIETAEKALAIAKKLGDSLYIVSTSFGSAMSLYLATKHPEIKAIAMYSPCIKIFDDNAALLDNPWGLTIAKTVKGSTFNDPVPANANQPKFWTMHYHLNGAIALQNFLTHAMTPEIFKKVTCPVFMGYWYKDEEHQDKVVSVKAMLSMYDALGVAEGNKRKIGYPNAQNHVLGGYILANEYNLVYENTISFFKDIVKLNP